MVSELALSALIALALSTGAPPAGGGEPAEPLVLHSDRAERAARLRAEAQVSEETCPNYALSAMLALPVTQDDALVGYTFVTPRLCLARGVNEFAVTEQMHFIIDAMVRAAHSEPVRLNPDRSLDRQASQAAMKAAADAIIGEGRLEALILRGDDLRTLR